MSFLNLINKFDLQIETAARGAWLRAEVFCSFAIPLDWSICTVSEGYVSVKSLSHQPIMSTKRKGSCHGKRKRSTWKGVFLKM